MTPIFVTKLSIIIWKTDIDVQKIDCLLLVTYEMTLADFSV